MSLNRKFLEFENVGTSWTELALPSVPQKLTIKRARAEIVSGDGVSVALSIREKSEPTGLLDIPLEYGLTANPIDSGEGTTVWSERKSSSDKQGTIYVAVKCDAGTNNSVRVRLEYEGS